MPMQKGVRGDVAGRSGIRQRHSVTCLETVSSRFDPLHPRMSNLISDKIYIDYYKTKLTAEVLKSLTYTNPDYHMKRNLGLSVRGIPEKIVTYSMKDGMLEVFRGEYGKLKKADPSLQFETDYVTAPVKLQYINPDFELDDYQNAAIEEIKKYKQGVIHAVTSAGKSLMILKAICELGQRAIIVVHRKILMQQFIEDIEKYVRDEQEEKIKIGIIGAGKNTTGAITIAIDRTFAKNIKEYREQFGVVFMDECHLAPTATMLSVINNLPCERRYGFSGTLKRKDQKEFLIFAIFGPILYAITKEQLLDKNRVVPVTIEIVESRTLFDYESVAEAYGITRAHQIMEDALMKDPGRNQLIIDLVSKLKGKKTIILSKFVAPCYALQNGLKDAYGIQSGVITGKNTKEALESYNRMKHGDLEVIFATIGCVSTGISISDLDNIILITPIYSNELLLHQVRGRLFRSHPGKTHGTLYFIYDGHVFNQQKLKKFLTIMEK